MTLESVDAKMKDLFGENVFEADIIHDQSQQRIPAPGSSIPEGLDIHQPPERRVKKINDRQNKIPCAMNVATHVAQNTVKMQPDPNLASIPGNLPLLKQADREAHWQRISTGPASAFVNLPANSPT